MKSLRILLIILSLSGCKKTEVEKPELRNEVSDTEIYEIVNLVMHDADYISRKYDGLKEEDLVKFLLDEFSGEVFSQRDSVEFIKPDSVFSKKDLKFIARQIDQRKKFKFDQKFISNKKIISTDTIQNMLQKRLTVRGYDFHREFKNKFNSDWYYTISLPIFSIDKRTVFVNLNGATERTMIYRKMNSRWKLNYVKFR